MSKLTIAPVLAGYRSAEALTQNFEAIADALENTVSRDGTAPNEMGANLDMDSNRILNLPEPLASGEPVRLAELEALDITAADLDALVLAAETARDEAEDLRDETQGIFDDTETLLESSTGVVSVMQVGLAPGVPDTTGRVAAAIALATTLGRPIYFPKATAPWLINPTELTVSVINEGEIKLVDSAALVSSTQLYVFKITTSNISIINRGTINFNRDGQSKSAFNTAGGGNGTARHFYAIWAQGTLATPLTNIVVTGIIKNSADYGFYGRYLTRPKIDIEIETSGAGMVLRESSYLDVKCNTYSLDNDGWKVYPHALDLFNNVYGNVEWNNYDHFGDDTVAGGGSLSDWVSGLTGVFNIGLGLSGHVNQFRDGVGTKSLGISLLGMVNCRAGGWTLHGWTDSGIEADVSDCTLSNITVDGDYHEASNTGSGWGINVFSSAYTANFLGRFTTQPHNIEFNDVKVVRNIGTGWRIGSMSGCRLVNCSAIGNERGLWEVWAAGASGDLFPSQAAQPHIGNQILGGTWSYNERDGILLADGSDTLVLNVICKNNGQATANSGNTRIGGSGVTTGSGFNTTGGTGGLTRTGNVYDFVTALDDQTGVNLPGSASPDTPTELSVPNSSLYSPGQYINLNGCGTAGADLITYITDVQGDILYLADAIVTFPTTAGTGTLATSGRTGTGTGTNFRTSAQRRIWVKSGSDYRLLIAATTDTSCSFDEAFPVDLSGAAFDFVTINVDQIRTQHYGITLGVSDLRPIVRHPNFGSSGNITANVLDSTAAATAAWIEPAIHPIFIPCSSFLRTSAGTIPTLENGGGGRILGWAMDAASDEIVAGISDIPNPYAKTVRVKAVYVNNGAGSGDVVLNFSYQSLANGGNTNAAFAGTGNKTDTALAQHIVREFDMGTITITPGAPLFLRFQRTGSNGSDTLANDILFMGVRLEPA